MVEKSNFTNETIINEVKKNYGICVNRVDRIIGGSANIYKLYSDSGIYILKEFQKWYKSETILKEVHVIQHLRGKGIKVPEYIRCLNGNYSFNYMGNEVIVQKYIEGYVKKTNTGGRKDLLESARILGLIINSLEDYPYDDLPSFDLEYIMSKEKLRSSISKNTELIKNTNDELITSYLKNKEFIINNLLDVNLSDDFKNITIAKSHGDFGILQLIYGDEITIIDFATAMEVPIAYEVIRSYACVDKKCASGEINIDNLIFYIREFNKYVPLNKYDLKYMAYIYLYKLASSSYGFKQYINNGDLDLYKVGVWRSKMCRYLYENYEYIGNRLINEFL